MLGVTAARASLLVGLLNLGSLVMSLAIGWLIQRFSAVRVMVPVLVGSGIMWVAIGALHAQFAILTLAVVVAGSLIGGAVTGVVAIVSTIYPDDIRATALGSGLGFGRIGQMVLPPLVGSILVWSGSPVVTLAACAVPCLLALVPLLAIVRGETARSWG